MKKMATNEENCAFLPPEVYQGNVFDPSVATFERFLENSKFSLLKEIFWEAEDEDDKEEQNSNGF